MRLVSTQEMRALEQAADRAGLHYSEMMENAGRAVAEVIDGYSPGDLALVLVGPGNNGGDGLVAARYLAEWGYQVSVLLWRRDTETDDPNLAKVQQAGLPIMRWTEEGAPEGLAEALLQADVLVDALLGTGAQGPLRGGLPELLGIIRDALAHRTREPARVADLYAVTGRDQPMVTAIDVPSGLNADTGEIDERALHADVTVTFACP